MTEPWIEKQELFVAGEGGYYTYRIPGLTVTPGGVVLAHTEARCGHGGDWDPIDILMRRSLDGGQTWTPAVKVVDRHDFGDGCINNFVCVADLDTGTTHALFCHNYQRAFALRSEDDGETWSAPVEITAASAAFSPHFPWRVLAIGPGHGIQLRTGRLLAPVWLASGEPPAHRPNRCATIYSDDHGASWQAGELVPDSYANQNESTAVELADGRVMLNIRNLDDGLARPAAERRRAVSISPDGISRWAPPWHDDALTEPVCFASLCRYSLAAEADRDRLLFAHPDSLEQTYPNARGSAADRKNETIHLSYDEGVSWPVSKVIEPGPSAYPDLAVLPDGTILCLYECGMATESMYLTRALTLARFNLAWVTDGADPGIG